MSNDQNRTILYHIKPHSLKNQPSKVSEEMKALNKKISIYQNQLNQQRAKEKQMMSLQNLENQFQYEDGKLYQEIGVDIEQFQKNQMKGQRYQDIQKLSQIKLGEKIQKQSNQEQNNAFDFLTGVGIANEEQPQQKEEEKEKVVDDNELEKQQKIEVNNEEQEQTPQIKDLRKNFQKIEKNYENQIYKAMLRKQMFPKMAQKRVTPKLYITSKHNSLKPEYKCFDSVEQKIRVYNKEFTPSKLEILMPTFTNRKPANNQIVQAYVENYGPLLQGQIENLPKNIRIMLEKEQQDQINLMNQIQFLQEVDNEENKQQQNQQLISNNAQNDKQFSNKQISNYNSQNQTLQQIGQNQVQTNFDIQNINYKSINDIKQKAQNQEFYQKQIEKNQLINNNKSQQQFQNIM
ncbi:hypothetical protein PPERSA_01635 [Pseudocohnilembus persalinus]|uniref:Uncharacterized protein n=1 Tax=Pseudocohnilembus persalinus TaxID=266149 RepID=A0A0V0R4M4_PSEPJ|nr:hypothetical protein PPERSA_01635 [Pseudocohnilembus persalinus]|eukprot:KRX09435.1 hypothetical protein PPERSA_01635 [Pseudocohnilembus persalinus]